MLSFRVVVARIRALGARRSDIRRLGLQKGPLLILLGIAAGLATALALTRAMASLLCEVKSTDAPTFSIVVILLSSAALVGAYLPAWRATRLDPLAALRRE